MPGSEHLAGLEGAATMGTGPHIGGGSGFADPSREAARAFRAVLDAMARPGRIVPLTTTCRSPQPLRPATAAVLLTLLDHETTLWCDEAASAPEVRAHLAFHTGVRLVVGERSAAFALALEPRRLTRLVEFSPGEPEYPDRSATLILQVDGLRNGAGPELSGPGILGTVRLEAEPLPEAFWSFMAGNHQLYPLGVDVLLVAPEAVAALPRSTRSELTGGP